MCGKASSIQKMACFRIFLLVFHYFEESLSRIGASTDSPRAFGIYLLHVPLLELLLLGGNRLFRLEHISDALLLGAAARCQSRRRRDDHCGRSDV